MSNRTFISRILHRYFVDGLSGMALGLFATLIIGLIIKQVGGGIGGAAGSFFVQVGSIAIISTGVGIGVGVAHRLAAPSLVLYATAVTGMFGAYAGKIISGSVMSGGAVSLLGPGDPLGAFLAALAGVEVGRLLNGKTRLDILVTPFVTIMAGGIVATFIGPPISQFVTSLGQIIIFATQQQPFIMGMLISVAMGIFLTLPVSSAAIAIVLGLSGLAAGAATVGCASQMVGFAVASYRENRLNGLLAQGLGTSMLQIPNIVRNPLIWLPAIIASAVLGPVATMVFAMENNSSGAGMGTAGLVGPIMTWNTMIGSHSPSILLFKIGLMHFILPAIIALGTSECLRRIGWIKPGDMTLYS